MMRFVEILTEFLAPFFRVFTQQRQGAFVLTRRVKFDINLFIFQEAVKVRDLRDHADRANNRKRCGHNFVRHAGHHVATARRHFIYGNGQRDLFFTQAL